MWQARRRRSSPTFESSAEPNTPQDPLPASAMTSTCHACVLRGGAARANPRDAWRLVCADCAGAPVLVPAPRVRLCAERVGTWGQSRDVWQTWDTGFGAVLLVRKHYLAPKPDGNVAIVFQSEADAVLVDKLLGTLAVKPNRPLPLRYCHNSKGLCTGICFASSADTSCMAHPAAPKKTKEKAKGDADSRPAKRARLSSDSLMRFDFSACSFSNRSNLARSPLPIDAKLTRTSCNTTVWWRTM